MAIDGPGAHRRPWWLVAVLTFVVGVLAGAALLAAMRPRPEASDPAAGPDAPAGVVPSAGTIVVPASCARGLERARAALASGGEAADALRRLQTARLQRILDDLQHAQADVDRLAAQCRRETGTGG